MFSIQVTADLTADRPISKRKLQNLIQKEIDTSASIAEYTVRSFTIQSVAGK